MSYSDYGGYAYRNGERVEDRSDFTLTLDGGFGTPGMWPGFGLLLAGYGKEKIEEMQDLPNGHAVLGDGPIMVTMYKQSSIGVHRIKEDGIEEISLLDIAVDLPPGKVAEFEGRRYLDCPYAFTDDIEPTVFEIDGWRLEILWAHEDNYYCYAKLTQPDGVVWTGFSGYGVGAGLEDCGYGFSTAEREGRLVEIFS